MLETNSYKKLKYACYITNMCMAVVVNLSPLLFVTFYNSYNISFGLLGLLVAINFSTQLLIDIIFSIYSKKFNIVKTIKLMPLIATFGFLIYGLIPTFFPSAAYIGIVIGTVIFSISSGLSEVLISPLVAAIPCDNPDAEMSKLHSTYAWGVVVVVILSTLFLKIFGTQSWNLLALFWGMIPLIAFFMFISSPFPELNIENKKSKKNKSNRNIVLICFFIIFLGGATECTMAQWVSGFIEKSLNIPKATGDILGTAGFALLLALGRTIYSKKPVNILKVMFVGMTGAFICYVISGLTMNIYIAVTACALTGFCASMLWPGTLIYLGGKIPDAGVSVYALMAAGGDMGASIVPQLVGIIADITGIQAGILASALFPAMGIIIIGATLIKERASK